MDALTLVDGKKIIAPEEVDITEKDYFDDLEYDLWDTIKHYLDVFGIQLENKDDDEPDWYTVKTVQDKIVEVLQEAGVNFKTDTAGRKQEEGMNLEFPVVLHDKTIDVMLEFDLKDGISHWGNIMARSNRAKEFYRELTAGGEILLHDRKSGDVLRLTKEKLIKGFRQYLTNPTSADILEFVDHELVIDLDVINSEIVDKIVQYAVFGEIRYIN